MTAENKIKQNKISFRQIWQRYGTLGILVLLLVILALLKPQYFFKADTITQAEVTGAAERITRHDQQILFHRLLGKDIGISSGRFHKQRNC